MNGTGLAPEALTPRLAKLKDDLIQTMPIKKAADRATLASKSLGEVVVQYLTYRARLIRRRPRTVVIWPEVMNSPHYPAHKQAVERIAASLKAGDDMNAYLSNQVRTNVYAGNLPTSSAGMSNEEWVRKAWRGKDRVRVTVDTHHLHLGALNADGTVGRTGPLLFAGITTTQAFLLTIGDHDSFNDGSISGLMYDKLEARVQQAGGGLVLPPGLGVTLAGTQVKDTFRGIDIVKTIRATDARLTSEGYPDVSQREIHLDWDDIVVVDATNGLEVSRETGKL